MKSLISRVGFSAALYGLLLAGCNAIEDVREDPSTAVPTPSVALVGTITGLGSQRSVTLQNNGNGAGARSFTAAIPTVPTSGAVTTPFSFGAVPVGSAYKIEVKLNPYGKTCTVADGTGTVTAPEALHIVVTCVNAASVPRYSVTVKLPTDSALFSGLPNARVQLTTEEAIYEQTVTSGQTSVVFPDSVFNASTQGAAFRWTVTASTTENNVANKCFVTTATNTNPAGNVVSSGTTGPAVGDLTALTKPPCQFSISGVLAYNAPPSTTYTPTTITGLALQLRDVQENVIETLPIADCTPATFSATCPFTFALSARSNSKNVYDVAVSTQPVGQTCVVANNSGAAAAGPIGVVAAPASAIIGGGTASLYVTGTTNPASVTSLQVICRANPAATAQLSGVYRLTSMTWTAATAGATPVTSLWTPFDFSIQNTASSNMISFFKDGTFIYGTHAVTNQVEQGFYEYIPPSPPTTTTGKLRFTVIVDTNTSNTFPANWSPASTTTTSSSLVSTPGISAAPGPLVANGVNHRTLGNVVVGTGTPRTISGTFGIDATTAQAARLDWVLSEPQSVNGEFTGTWINRSHRRFWVWDYATYYGMHVGVNGAAVNMQDACFTMENLHVSSGIYTRRGSSTGCYPFNRPYTSQFFSFTGAESIDIASPSGLPGFVGRIPGGATAFDGRSPSPIQWVVAPVANFASVADHTFFPTSTIDTSWCTTEMLGIRSTLNNAPIDFPVYFCRVRAP